MVNPMNAYEITLSLTDEKNQRIGLRQDIAEIGPRRKFGGNLIPRKKYGIAIDLGQEIEADDTALATLDRNGVGLKIYALTLNIVDRKFRLRLSVRNTYDQGRQREDETQLRRLKL